MTAPTELLRPRDRRGRRPERTQLDAFPRDPVARWLLRVVFAAPFVATALLLSGAADVGTPNRALLHELAGIGWTRSDADWIGQIYPPLSTLLAMVIPGGRIGLAIAGGVVAGFLLQKMLETLVQRHFPRSTTVILMLALAANPLFFYTTLEAFASILGLALFGLGVADAMRFVVWRNTRSGFRSGLLLMMSVLSGPSGVLYVTTTALSTPFLELGRRGQPGARGANLLVVIFPTVAALGSVLLLDLLFLGRPFAGTLDELGEGLPERWQQLGTTLLSPAGALLAAPVLCAWAVALIVRRPGAIAVSTLTVAAVLGAYVLGLLPPGTAGVIYILFALLAIALIPTARSRWAIPLIDVVAVALLAIAWVDALQRPVILDWLAAVGSALGAAGG